MGKKCVVSGCLEAASFQWEYGDFLTYTCRTHCIKGDIGTSGRKPMVDERKSSGGFGINCRVFVGVCVFMCLFGVLCNLVEGQHYFIDGLARKLDDLKSFSSISHKFKPELAEIKSLINELKPVNSQKKKNNFKTPRLFINFKKILDLKLHFLNIYNLSKKSPINNKKLFYFTSTNLIFNMNFFYQYQFEK